jgi:hypothetical protein
MSRSNKRNAGWVVIVFEKEEYASQSHSARSVPIAYASQFYVVAYVKGPFKKYKQAEDWADRELGVDGLRQITFLA